MRDIEQQFLNELDAQLWKAADKLRSHLDAANYKHVVLGLIFLKYVSDAFEERQQELIELFQKDDGDNIYYLPREDYVSDEDYKKAIEAELEIKDYYAEKNVFWVPKIARWSTLKEKVILPTNSVIGKNDLDEDVKMRSASWLIDNAFDEIEKANPKLKGILNRIIQYQLDTDKLIGLVNEFSTTRFHDPEYKGEKLSLKSKDILGHVYEYFLGQFALAEGKQGGQYYTPKSIVTLIVEMLEPYKGRVYDPAMGSGGFFVSSDKFIEEHARVKHYDPADQKKQISVYGQESNPTTWWHEKLGDDVRWTINTNGQKRILTPPEGNANFAWMLHMLYHLAPTGSMALLLANGSMSSNTNNEGEIRKMVEQDLVECMVALPGQLFTNTQIPACIWFLTKDKNAKDGKRDRRGQVLFIDARNLGYMKDRVLRDFKDEDIKKIADTFHAWKREWTEKNNQAGFWFSADLAAIKKHDFVLTPGRYVGAEDEEDDGIPFADKMATLTSKLKTKFEESDKLKGEIRKNLAGLGFDV